MIRVLGKLVNIKIKVDNFIVVLDSFEKEKAKGLSQKSY